MASLLTRCVKNSASRLWNFATILQQRPIATGSVNAGLEEFFPPGALESNQPIAESVKTGRRWRANELRVKSSSDLHKLWFVLLKERNMLLTVNREARRQGVPMPSPGRMKKVQRSMAMIKLVIHERELAIRAIEKMEWNFDKKYETELFKQNRLGELEEMSNDTEGNKNDVSESRKDLQNSNFSPV